MIRNNLLVDEGDAFNELLQTKTLNNLKALNFFSKVESEIIDVSKREDLVPLLKNFGFNNFSLTILAILLNRKNTILHLSAGGKVDAFEVAYMIDPSDSFGRLNSDDEPKSIMTLCLVPLIEM